MEIDELIKILQDLKNSGAKGTDKLYGCNLLNTGITYSIKGISLGFPSLGRYKIELIKS